MQKIIFFITCFLILSTSVHSSEWDPLCEQNISLCKNVQAGLVNFTNLKSVFDEEHDEFYLGLSFYLLKLFADFGDQDLNREDIKVTLEILEKKYDFAMPEVLMTIIEQVSILSFKRDESGKKTVTFYFRTSRGASIDLTKLLKGKFTGTILQPQRMHIAQGAKFAFVDDETKVGRPVAKRINKFASYINSTSKDRDLTTQVIQDSLKHYSKLKSFSLSPLFMSISGITMHVLVDLFFISFETSPVILSLIVTPNLNSYDQNSPLPSFHVRGRGSVLGSTVTAVVSL
ncbi:MAG: hypothetical protein ISR65_03020 [Bacteriovoracaceae bacterium]|nr:hypothetical protein [Bacteriovoracaceae bacterium]